MGTESEREPLASQDVNKAPTMVSKLKPPSKLPMSSAKKPAPGPVKRKAVDDLDPRELKFTKKFDGAVAGSKFPRPTNTFDGRPSAIGTRSSKTTNFLDGRPSSIGTRSHTGPTRNATSRPTVNKTRNAAPVPSRTNTGRPAATLKRSVSGPVGTSRGAPKPPAGAAKAPSAGGAAKKRAAWDYKGRLQDMEEMLGKNMSANNNLVSSIETFNSRIQALEAQNAQLKGDIGVKEVEKHEVSKERQNLEKQLRDLEQATTEMKRKHHNDLEDLQMSNGRIERQRDTLQGEINAATQEISGLKLSLAQLTSAQAGLNAEFGATKIQLEQSLEYGRLKDSEIVELKASLAAQIQANEDQASKLIEHETERRKLHNTIQELKGNIRVFCRVRPLLGEELKDNEDGVVTHMHFPDDCKTLEMEKLTGSSLNDTKSSGKNGSNGKGHDFAFDRVFSPESSQACVFEEISQLVQSALDGYNVCIFAYGQTGSGKTYTMEGNGTDTETMGMIPRAIQQIFHTSKDLENKGWQYLLEASFLEIYNETLRDLLGEGKDDQKHDIKLAGPNSNEVVVTNLTLVDVKTQEQVHTLLTNASHNRAVAETKCNERSSRSHSVFRMKITGNNSVTGESCVGNLNLVDLAGSERLKESGSQGARLKETQAINKSLSNLGNVIMALANKDNHIPYRNSKLTHLLQNSLGGNSKTLMFVNVSPKEDSFSETLNSLRFATKVNQCNIGTAQKKSK
ncbi:carboxy-terminal kinesin 2-like [Lineus longissimus]|uniref:carboxy-terminal kinesin 2-like n=1 Tax=Lineus longissimus TaxID=88925 RepID=UPI002B4F549C